MSSGLSILIIVILICYNCCNLTQLLFLINILNHRIAELDALTDGDSKRFEC